jgi:hypothetical protein
MHEHPDTTGGAYVALFMLFGPVLLILAILVVGLLVACIRRLFQQKVRVLRMLDEDGRVLNEMDYDEDATCWGSRTGAIGELCGGCCRCIEMQMAHYGTRYEIVDEYR